MYITIGKYGWEVSTIQSQSEKTWNHKGHQQSDLMESPLMTRNTTTSPTILGTAEIDTQIDGELIHLLMPIWAYQSAAVYLIFISVFGLLMNIVVVIVIISDPQVGPFGV